MVKCRYDSSKDCFHDGSCSIFDRVSGSVSVCPLFRGGDFFVERHVERSSVSVFSKHLRRK